MGDSRATIFMPLAEFEASIAHLSDEEKRAARVAHVQGGIDLYWSEREWKRACKPSYGVLCLIPLFWPVLWYRGQMSRMTQSVIAEAIQRCREAWPDDLADAGLDFDGVAGTD